MNLIDYRIQSISFQLSNVLFYPRDETLCHPMCVSVYGWLLTGLVYPPLPTCVLSHTSQCISLTNTG